jgi:hypothetical protein
MGSPKLNIPLGSRYGSLLVTGPETKKGKSRAMTCLCDCGKTTVVTCSNLHIGAVRSCGCSHIKDEHKNLIGKIFGRLTVLDDSERRRNGTRVMLCQCSCGNKAYAIVREMVNGRTVSCGCYGGMKLGIKNTRHGHTANHKVSPEYKVWSRYAYPL